MNYGALILMTLVTFFRGSGGGKESHFGMKLCDAASWVALVFLVVVAVFLTALAAKLARVENQKKKDVGYKFTKGD